LERFYHDRLQVWGLGLFDGEVDLDKMLEFDYAINGSPALGLRIFCTIFIKIILYIGKPCKPRSRHPGLNIAELILVVLLSDKSHVLDFQERLATFLGQPTIKDEVLYYSALREELQYHLILNKMILLCTWSGSKLSSMLSITFFQL